MATTSRSLAQVAAAELWEAVEGAQLVADGLGLGGWTTTAVARRLSRGGGTVDVAALADVLTWLAVDGLLAPVVSRRGWLDLKPRSWRWRVTAAGERYAAALAPPTVAQ